MCLSSCFYYDLSGKKICFKSKFVLCNHCSAKTRCFVSNRRILIRGWKPATDFLVVRFFFQRLTFVRSNTQPLSRKGPLKEVIFHAFEWRFLLQFQRAFFVNLPAIFAAFSLRFDCHDVRVRAERTCDVHAKAALRDLTLPPSLTGILTGTL